MSVPAQNAADAAAEPDPIVLAQHPVVVRLDTGVGVGEGARKGAVWAVGARVLGQLAQFVGTVVTARLLLPSDFGVMAVVLPVLAFGGIFNSLGLGSSIIHAERVTEKLLSTVFWLHLSISVGLTALVAALAVPVGRLFDIPSLPPVLALASLIFVCTRGLVPTALLERALRFKQLAVVETVCAVLGVAATIVTALLGAGAYSLVVGPLVNEAGKSIGATLLVRWAPGARPDLATLRSVWQYTRGITGFSLLNFWARNADNLLLARFVDLTSLGFYNRAYSLMRLPVYQVNTAMSRVLFPAITRLRDDRPRLGRAWLRALAAAAVVAAPVGIGMSVAAPALVEVLLGRRWLGMVPVFQLLALAAVPQTLTTTFGGLLRATGATSTLFRLGLVTSGMSLTAMVLGLPWGTIGVAAALTVKFYLELPIGLRPCLRETHLGWWDLVVALRGIWAASLLLGAAGLAVRLAASGSWTAWQVLLAQAVACSTAYVVGLWLFHREPLVWAWTAVRSRLRRRAA